MIFMTKHLIIGMGEIGTSLAEVLECNGIDKGDEVPRADIIHICFPYSDQFVDLVKKYKTDTEAGLVVIHSTVPIGTTNKCSSDAVHSPMRGKHPRLAEGIKIFVKFFGGQRDEEVASYFSSLGIETITTTKAENTEAMKLWDTEIYREAILLNKRIHQYCEEHGLDFDLVYTLANKTYNDGYAKLGRPEYTEYVLKYIDGPISGHYLEPNHLMLNQ